MLFRTTFPALLLAGLTIGAAIPSGSFSFGGPALSRRAATAASQILQIAPTSNTCSGATYADECETAAQAAPYLISAMQTYSITSAAEIAALLSLVAYETGDFKYSTNHFPSPGRPGQGTRNMQMATYNLLYAQSISALSTQVAAITTATTTAGLSDDELNAIRALVLPDQYSWASAAWFYTSQCSSSVRTQVQAGGQAGYEAYLGCVGTTATSDRLAYWTRANTALGLS
ncbi:hypothetical protein BP6252_00191 [Coleophoma cylindrospora]|uniref:Uncharacterized protein n=1 Tax=Coleophoma cylindrospora TaxID=1849047 RepID=A0A3D8SPB0_9HELO|nr:hypothetical protein BP6252_00191 [Coleophoma cylindrospora]